MFGVVGHGNEVIAGARVQGVVFVSGCGRDHGSFPLETETNEVGQYRLELFHMTPKAFFHACVEITATDVQAGRSGMARADGIRFLISPPYDSVRMDVVLQ